MVVFLHVNAICCIKCENERFNERFYAWKMQIDHAQNDPLLHRAALQPARVVFETI